MSQEVAERVFEKAIECGLLQGGPDACPEGASGAKAATVVPEGMIPGSYQKRRPDEYDRGICLLPRDVLDFVIATQPKEWQRLGQHHGSTMKDVFLKRLSSELQSRGALDVLRNGLKDSGVKFHLAYFRPASGLNEETRRLHAANVFSVVRQLHYSTKDEKSLDLVIFLNGIPIFTGELKNPLNGQDVRDAMHQYCNDRDPREPLLSPGRCLAHFSADPQLVYVTTRLEGASTRFLPFNQGRFGGAGNPPVPPTQHGYATAYLWENTWTRDSVLDLIRQYVQEVQEEDAQGRKIGKRYLIFPRYQQLDCVRKLVADAREKGAGQRYLVQHSAGSGKSYTIAWLAHHLAILHDARDNRVFDSIVVITDRRVLDRQLQNTMRQFEQTLGVVENIDTTSRQLKEALESGKTIIVTTLQKFPVIASQIGELPGKRFAVIVDEAHSSQSGENTRTLRSVLAEGSLEDAEREEAQALTPEEELDGTILAEIEKRGRLPNVSTFAFTATPKSKTLELFGTRREDGTFVPFHLYSMRQAIEEGFILDVLASYTTYKAYWRLLKKIQDDPRYDKAKAEYLLKSFVELHPHAIAEKVRIMMEHFTTHVQSEIGGSAKAMIVTRSRRHAVRYKLAVDRFLSEAGHPFKALGAFSGSIQDNGQTYTEAGMNGFPESQTAKAFERPDYRILIVANKFQTGFDQPLLHTMYVDKKLGGVNAVQTLSRLNRIHPRKSGTLVLDFANEADDIRKAFDPYYEATLLSEATDPNLLYTLQTQLTGFGVFTQGDLDAYARAWFDQSASMDRLYAALGPTKDRVEALSKEERHDFRDRLTDFIRLYAFLAQILTFADVDLEKLYLFGRGLRRLLREERETLPVEVQQNIDMESYRIQQTAAGQIKLKRGSGTLDPAGPPPDHGLAPEDLEPLSRIIAELNERFGLSLGPEHRVTLGQIMGRLDEDTALDAAARVNTRENVRLSFDQKVENAIQDIVDINFTLYKRITDDRAFGEAIKNLLFDQYLRAHRNAEDLIKRSASKSLEFVPALRGIDGKSTDMVLRCIAAFLNTEGGDLLVGVTPDRRVVGMESDQFESDDAVVRYLEQSVRDRLGEAAVARIEPRIQIVNGRMVCVIGCARSSEPVFYRATASGSGGDFYIRTGSRTLKLAPESVTEYSATRFSAKDDPAG